MDFKHFIVACIPAFNEERTIAGVVIKAMRHVDKVIVCDDGSTDLTGEIAEKLGAEVVKHERNQGYGAALSTLFKKAREMNADILVMVDADGQHNPDDIPKLLTPIINGEADIVIGSRFIGKAKEEIPGYRKAGIKVITGIAKTASYNNITDAQSGFRAYNRKAIERIRISETGMGASTEILIKAKEHGLRITEVPVKIKYSKGSSTQNPIFHGVDVILSTVKYMSIRRPLLFYGVPGFMSLLVAIFFWIWTLQIFAEKRQVVTNIALIAIATTIVGLMLLTTAVILWVLVSILREKR
ncbi:MAG: glycosyltransferase family 2 protein [Thermoproteota archaeon]